VAQVVEVQARHADRLDGVWPGGHLIEVASPQRTALSAGEDQRAAEKHHDGGGRAAPVNGEKDAR